MTKLSSKATRVEEEYELMKRSLYKQFFKVTPFFFFLLSLSHFPLLVLNHWTFLDPFP